jgi:hypothetical protein
MKKEALLFFMIILSAIFVNAQNISYEIQEIEKAKKDIEAASIKIKDLESRLVSQLKQEQPKEKLLFIFYLLGLNLILILFVIFLLFYLYRKYIIKRYGIGEIHPVPKELIDFVYSAMKSDKKTADIRMELAKKGWAPSMIEHAIDAAKEKK